MRIWFGVLAGYALAVVHIRYAFRRYAEMQTVAEVEQFLAEG